MAETLLNTPIYSQKMRVKGRAKITFAKRSYPQTIVKPNQDGGIGYYARLVSKNEEGVEITGEFSLLNLAGSQILGEQLYSSTPADAHIFILSGAYLPRGADIGTMNIDRLHAQGIYAPYFTVGSVEELADFSAALIEETLDLSYLFAAIDLNLRDGNFNTIELWGDSGRHLKSLDIRGTLIQSISGEYPCGIERVLLDSKTHIPQKFEHYLRELEIKERKKSVAIK